MAPHDEEGKVKRHSALQVKLATHMDTLTHRRGEFLSISSSSARFSRSAAICALSSSIFARDAAADEASSAAPGDGAAGVAAAAADNAARLRAPPCWPRARKREPHATHFFARGQRRAHAIMPCARAARAADARTRERGCTRCRNEP